MPGREENALPIWQECYAQCFQEKRHYDLLSWSIGGGFLAFTALAANLILQIPPGSAWARLALALSTLPLFVIWIWVYERNRIWGEISNEMARDIERRFGVDGLQLRYMRAVMAKRDVRENSDLPAALRTLPDDLVPGTPSPIRIRVPSMHHALYLLGGLVAAAPILLALLPVGGVR